MPAENDVLDAFEHHLRFLDVFTRREGTWVYDLSLDNSILEEMVRGNF